MTSEPEHGRCTDEAVSRQGESPRAVEINNLLARLAAMAETEDPARLRRIAEIKRAIEAGTYHVDAAQLARKILQNLEEG